MAGRKESLRCPQLLLLLLTLPVLGCAVLGAAAWAAISVHAAPSLFYYFFYTIPLFHPLGAGRCGCEYHLLHCHLPAGRD